MTGIMSLNSTICFYLLFFLVKNVCCRGSNDLGSQRIARDSPREYASDDPNFWPVRGRRDDKNYVSLHDGDSYGSGPLPRGARKSKEEETGVFWAGRGRSFLGSDASGGEDDNFWAHRGRSADPETEERSNRPEEPPGWILVARREPKTEFRTIDRDSFTCLKPGKTNKSERIRQNLCHLKRKSNKYLRDISQSEQFWPARGKKSDGYLIRAKTPIKAFPVFLEDDPFLPLRGKKDKETWRDDLNNLKSFWPARGKRIRDQIIDKYQVLKPVEKF